MLAICCDLWQALSSTSKNERSHADHGRRCSPHQHCHHTPLSSMPRTKSPPTPDTDFQRARSSKRWHLLNCRNAAFSFPRLSVEQPRHFLRRTAFKIEVGIASSYHMKKSVADV
eukprot:5104020-Pleurochrysis_carterae.AAC.2